MILNASKFKSEDLYLKRAKFVMKVLGLWIPARNENIASKCYRFLILFLPYSFLLFQIIFIIIVWGDLEAISEASYLLFTEACLCLKITVLQINIDMLKDLLRRMNEDIFFPQSKEHERILKLQAKRIKMLLLAYMISSQATCGLWALKPLFDDAGSRKFPFDMWMPVSPESSPQYELGYMFQYVTISISAFIYFGVDSITLSMIIFACAQLRIIKDKLLKIGLVKKARNSVEKRMTMAENYTILINCIKHHQAVVSFTEVIENAYHIFLLFQFVGSVGLICMSALRILVIDWRSLQFFSIVLYLSVMVIHTYVWCWCGDELTVTSEELHTVLYECTWYEQDMKFMRTLLFAMLRMNIPIVLRAGHYISLSKPTFVSILRMSYSYYAVLNQTK